MTTIDSKNKSSADDNNTGTPQPAKFTVDETDSTLDINQFDGSGFTKLHYAIRNKDRELVFQLIRANADLMVFREGYTTPLMYAIAHWPAIVPSLLNEIPPEKRKSTKQADGSELQVAVTNTPLLAQLCEAGFRDCADINGVTALIRAAEIGKIDSVRLLLDQARNDNDADTLQTYINCKKKSGGKLNALYSAVKNNTPDIAKLLIEAGAERKPPNGKFLVDIVRNHNIILLKGFLAVFARGTPGMITLVWLAAKDSWTDGIDIIEKCFAEKNIRYDFAYKNAMEVLVVTLEYCDRPATAAVLRLFKRNLLQPETFISLLDLTDKNLDSKFFKLLPTVFKDFQTKVELNFSIQIISNQLLSDKKWLKYPQFTRDFIGYAIERIHGENPDKETVMCLLQLSEKVQDYRLATVINHGYTTANFLKTSNIQFDRKWISDPVMRDFLSDVPSNSLLSKGRWLGKKLLSPAFPSRHEIEIDSAGLSNDLIFALREKSISAALDNVFKDHKLSGLVSQALKHALEGLITKLCPDLTMRSHAVCRFIIGYCFSTLSESAYLNNHNGAKLMQSDDHWKNIKDKVNAEIEAVEEAGLAIIDSFAANLSSKHLLPLVTRSTIDSLNKSNAESELSAQFQSALGLLETPAQRLAAACMSAGKRWQSRLPSSAQGANHRFNISDLEAPFKQSIGQALLALKQQPKLPDQIANGLLDIELDLVSAFHQIVFFQIDLIEQAFGVFRPLPGDTIANLVQRLGEASSFDDTSDSERNRRRPSESTDSDPVISEESDHSV